MQVITPGVLAVLAPLALLLLGGGACAPAFHASRGPVPEGVAARMRHQVWHVGCPTEIADLAYLRLSYWGFDGAAHEGELVVNQAVAEDVLAVFRVLYQRRFPIERMKLADDYQGDDDASMADNNTSAFNCRFVPGKPGVFSKHSQGRAIDINPRINPMVTGKTVLPPAGTAFLDAGPRQPGILRRGAPAVAEFTRRGWTWGGTWVSLKDYQHFEK